MFIKGFIAVWIVGSLVGGFSYAKSLYGEDFPCDCEEMGYGTVAVVELSSPLWYPFRAIGWLIVNL